MNLDLGQELSIFSKQITLVCMTLGFGPVLHGCPIWLKSPDREPWYGRVDFFKIGLDNGEIGAIFNIGQLSHGDDQYLDVFGEKSALEALLPLDSAKSKFDKGLSNAF